MKSITDALKRRIEIEKGFPHKQMTMADVQKNMMNEALVNAGFTSDGSDSFKECWIFDHSAGIITLSYKDIDGSEHLVVRPLNRDGMALALAAKKDAIKHGRIVLW